MRLFMTLLVGCVLLAVLQYALAALVVALCILILWGAIMHPAETLGAMAFFLVGNVIINHTVACLTLAGFIGFLVILRKPGTSTSGSPDQTSGAPTDNGHQSDDSA